MTLLKKTASFVLAAAMLAGCGSAASTASTAASTTSAAAASSGSGNILTIATTNQLSTLNPLQMNWNFVDMYATGLEFLPLAVLDDNYEFTPMLVESITTDDNLTFHVKVADNAAWSDGEPVTSDDIIWTILKMTSPAVANTHFDFSMIKGLESGLSEEGADSVEGLVKVDDKDLDGVMDMLPKDAIYYFTQPQCKRAFSVKKIAAEGEKHHLKGKSYETVGKAYEAALADAKKDDFIFVGGSSYVVADLLEHLQDRV